MYKVRFRYSKTGRAKYISHLDLMSTLQRSFLRAGIKLKYSEGFNPHPYMSVALPLSVGCESICELIDVGFADDCIPDIRTIKLPDGLTITEVYRPAGNFADITWVELDGKMYYKNRSLNDIIDELIKYFSKDSIIIKKRTKRGYKELDVSRLIKDAIFSINDCISVNIKVSAQNPTLNADDLISALDNELKPDYYEMKRIGIYSSNMILFN